jgi:ferredoxin-type protein NapG
MADNPQYGRRQFLQDSVLSVARTAQEYVKHRDAPTEKSAPPRSDWLRPPGAVPESFFLDRCTKCGDCLKACPYHSILPHAGDGFPIIHADQSPCQLCEEFPCAAACATEALVLPESREAVRMGTAVVSAQACTAGQGCHACVSQCPTQALAVDFSEFRLIVDGGRCVGCGICEQVCRTVNDRIAIRVKPARLFGG